MRDPYDSATILGSLYGDGILALQGAFDRGWVDRMRQEVDLLFQEALRQPGGVLPRGPERYYVEVHPERLRGFADLAAHPWFVAVCRAVLGPDYRIVEVGFDVPGPGAQDQPWHRDFPAPQATTRGRRLDSLAFNLTCVDTTEAMGPFEIALGTQWDDEPDFAGGMFPPRDRWPRYVQRAVRKLPQRGDLSVRSALTIHRGTANRSDQWRPVVVVGVDAPGATNAARHDLQITPAYQALLPATVRDHLTCRVVPRLEPIVQAHAIEGLLEPTGPSMGG